MSEDIINVCDELLMGAYRIVWGIILLPIFLLGYIYEKAYCAFKLGRESV